MTTTPTTYSRGARAIHWLTVLVLAALVPLGFFAAGAEPSDRILALRAHAVLGAALVALTLARIVLSRRAPRPAPLPMPGWRRALLKLDHLALYALLLALGLTGVGTVVSAEIVPALLGSGGAVTVSSELLAPQVHGTLAVLLLAAIGAHVAGVVAYQLFEGDALGRMLGRPLGRRRSSEGATPPTLGEARARRDRRGSRSAPASGT